MSLGAQGSCDFEVKGQVIDLETNEPLPFATIKIVGSEKGVICGTDGRFRIADICDEEVDLEIQYVGYKKLVHHHDFHHSDPIIYLAVDETLLESVVVEESRKEELKSLSVQRKEVDNLTLVSNSLSELTESLSGVTMLKTGTNISKPIIHGLHSNRVLVINDGVRHAYQVWGEEHAPEIDPSHVDQIEIVKGAGTVKYGPEALGGVILYNSKRPQFSKSLNGSIGSSYSSNGRAASSKLSIGHGTRRFAWNLGGFGIYQADLEAPNYNLSNTGKREYGGSFNALWHQSKFDFQVSGSYFEQEIGILRASIVGSLKDLQNAINDSIPKPTFAPTYDLQNPRQVTKHGVVKSNLALFLGDHVFNLQYAYQQNIRREFDVRRGELNDRPVIDLDLQSHTFEAEWIQPSRGLWQGTTGFQGYTQNSVNEPESNPANFVPDYDVLNLGAFTVQSLDFNKTTLEFGARFDYQSLQVADTIRETFTYANEIRFSNPTFTLGFKRQVSEHLSLYSNIGTAWRPPNVAELYSFGYHHSRIQFGLWRYSLEPSITTPVDSVFDQSFRNVPAEKGIKWVSGLELNKAKTTAEFIFYANRINDYIFLRPYGVTTNVAGTFAYFIYDQTDALFIGSDWDIRYQHSSELTSEIKLSYLFAKSIDRNQPLIEIPSFNADYTVEYKKGNWRYAINLDFIAKQWNEPLVIAPIDIDDGEVEVDRNTDIFDFMPPPNGFVLVGTKINYERKHWDVQIKAHNLFNRSYRIYTDRLRYFADAPGRNFTFSIGYKF